MKRKQSLKQRILAVCLCVCLMMGMVPQVPSVLTARADDTVVKVACVGDSLTEGYTSSGGLKGTTAYPAQLQNLLGSGYEVKNFGKTSMTLMKNTNKSYWNTTEYTQSMAYDADLVIIMLGTNDCKDAYWNETKFREDAKALVDGYKNLDSEPEVYFAISPYCYQTQGTDITTDRVDKVNAVQNALVEEHGWKSIDMYEKTYGKKDIFHSDGVHFTDEGYYYIAECMYELITGEKPPVISSTKIPHTQTEGDTNYFTFASGKWTNGNTLHTWSTVVDSSDPRSTWYEVTFTGNKIDIYAGKNYMMGKVEYFIDDTSIGVFDLYNSSNIDATLITTAEDLEDGTHVFRAEATGERNASGKGNLAIDAAHVLVYTSEEADPAVTPTPDPTPTPDASGDGYDMEAIKAQAAFAVEYEGEDQIFDGKRVEDYSEYADAIHDVMTGSIIVRFKVDSSCGERGVLLGAKDASLTPSAVLGSGTDCASIYILQKNAYRFAFKHTMASLGGPYSFTDGNWHCVVLSSMPTEKTLRLTIDGKEMWHNTSEVNRGLFGKIGILDQVTVGGHLDANGNPVNGFTGAISQIIVTDQVISDELAIEISRMGYSGVIPSGSSISKMFDNSTDPGDNTWVFTGGEAVQGTFEQIGGARNYMGHFEEYIRNQRSAGNDPTRQRYTINTAKAGQTIADVVEHWDEKVSKYQPKAVAYMVGAEDYLAGAEGLEAFKENLKAFIDLGLAEKENYGSYVVIQKPFAVKDDENNERIEAYCEAVDQVAASYKADSKKYDNLAVIDHYEQTKSDAAFLNTKLNADGSLNELGHLEIGRQMVNALAGTDVQYPCRQGTRMGQTEVSKVEEYLDIQPEIGAGSAGLNVELPKDFGTNCRYFLEIGDLTISDLVTESAFTITGLEEGAEYVLKIQSEDGTRQITTMKGVVEKDSPAAPYAQEKNENQMRLAEKMEEDSLTWLFMGDSITHALVYTYGYAGTAQLFEKYLKDGLGRTDDVVINTAVSGAHTNSTLNNIEQRLEKYAPDVVSIMLGTNDAYPDLNDVDPGLPISTDQYEANLRTIIDKIRKVNPDAIIILRCPTPMTSDDGRRANALLNTERMKKIVAEDPSIIYVDQYTEVQAALQAYSWLDDDNQLFLGNWLHPGINGQIVMMKQFVEACGLWSWDNPITNLYYETPMTKTTSKLVPEVALEEETLSLSVSQLASDSSMQVGAVTLSAVEKDGTKMYETKVDAGANEAVLANLPAGTYTVNVSSYLKNTASVVTFAAQELVVKGEACSHEDTEIINEKEVTCTEDGYTGDEVCAECGVLLDEGTTIEATGHSWSEWKVVKEATESEDGLKVRECSKCEEKEEESIPAVGEKPWVNPFTDVEEGKWYYDAVAWGSKNGVVNGLTETAFGTKENCTRAQIITFIWRAVGKPEASSAEYTFKDVEEGKYYFDAMLWGVEKGIITGYNADTFAPDDKCSRSQMATFIWRLAGEPKVAAEVSPFPDVETGKWYTAAAIWAAEQEVVTGYSDGTFGPKNDVLRSETITMLYRYFM